MRKLILASAAVIVIGGVGAGFAVTKAGAQTDPQALLTAFNDPPPGGPAAPAARPDKLGPDKDGPDKARPDKAGPDKAGQADDAPLALTDPQPLDEDAMVLAQNAPPPPGPEAAPGAGPGGPPPPPGMPRPGMEGRPGWGRGPMQGWQHRPMWHRAAMFGLFFHPADKQLTPADVQKIAEAFLLWQGNRDWKVTQVAAGPDGKIGFAFATSDGGVIARFTMDSKTGRLARVG
jgi:hypothetical protein